MRSSHQLSSLLGWTSIAFSGAIWLVVLLRLIPHVPPLSISANVCFVGWAIGIVLAFVAAAVGSRRWALAALVPVANFIVFFLLVNLMEPRGH
jgi:hypothetical protein